MTSNSKKNRVHSEDNPAWLSDLSGRERQIVGLSAAGLIDKAIAIELGITLTTLRTYWVRIRRKTGDMTRPALAVAFVNAQIQDEDFGKQSLSSKLLMSASNDPETLRRAAIYYGTAFQRIEDSLQRVQQVSRILASFPRQSLKVQNETELVSLMTRTFVIEGGYVIAWVGLPQNDSLKTVQVASISSLSGTAPADFNVSWAENERGNGPTGRAIRSSETQVSHDYLVDPSVEPWRKYAEMYGFQSSIALPLISDGNTIGVLSAYAREPNSFDKAEVQILELIANDFAISLAEIRRSTRP